MKNQYWMVVDNHRKIWTVSDTTQSQAAKKARDLYRKITGDHYSPCCKLRFWKPIRCSKALFNTINLEGSYGDYYKWTMIDGVAELDCHINTSANCNDMRSLINGAYEIVFMWKSDGSGTESQKQWRDDWLKRAKKHGAGFDE